MQTTKELTDKLFHHLQRGGSWGYYWSLPSKKTTWHPVGKNGVAPRDENVYFGVNPTGARRKDNERARNGDVVAVNALYADIDAKDFSGGKEAARAYVDGLPLQPSVLVDSGGGYQPYWLLRETFVIRSDSDRARIRAIQKAWIGLVGGDDGAKDIARILRLPGTTNGKYNPAPLVTFVYAEWDRLYDLADLEAISAPFMQPERTESGATSPGAPKVGDRYGQAALEGELAKVKAAQPGARNNTLHLAAFKLGTLIGGGAVDRATVEDSLLNAGRAIGLSEREAIATIKSGLDAGISKPRQIPERKASHSATAGAATTPESTPELNNMTPEDSAMGGAAAKSETIGAILQRKALTDSGNAECLEALHGGILRYCHTRKKWFIWNGEIWQVEDSGQITRAMLKTVRARQTEIPNIADDDKKKRYASWVVGSESRKRLNDAISLAGNLRAFATKIDLYDRDPMLANAGVVTLDFRTGTARANSQTDYITRRLGADYDPAATCPRWLQYLQEVFNDDLELIDYIRRAVGYSLTGDTREQKLFLCYGGGANGKSVFLTTTAKLMGDYGASRTFSTFDADERNRIGDDLAGLKGARFVSVIETNEDRRLNEARIKSLTGQDEISCRFLFGEYFSYRPAFKLWLAMNHKPTIQGVDRGIWRRIQLIPFTQAFEGDRQDKTLEHKLEAELPGILNWALQGLREWNAVGLKPPAAVTNATEQYQRESDLVGQWLEACTENGALMTMKSGDGYKSYKQWCESQGIKAFSNVIWGRRLAERGIVTAPRTGKGIFYQGIGLLTEVNQ